MSEYRESYKGVGQMIRSEFMRAAMYEQALRVLEDARRIAPVYWPGPHPKRYLESFYPSSGVRGGHRHDRAYGRVTNFAPEAYFVEWGTRNNPRHRTLGKALGLERDK